jgi:signal recognition particle subunit SRP19
MPHKISEKSYSSIFLQELLFRGRVRVQLKNDDGTPFSKDYPTRESLLVHIGKTIPQLKSRQNKPTETSSSSAQPTTASSSGAQKKSGKSKRR